MLTLITLQRTACTPCYFPAIVVVAIHGACNCDDDDATVTATAADAAVTGLH